MAPAQVYRLCHNRFQIECNFREAKQYLGLVTTSRLLKNGFGMPSATTRVRGISVEGS